MATITYEIDALLKKDSIILYRKTIPLGPSSNDTLLELFQKIDEYVYGCFCWYITNTLIVESGEHGYALELHVWKTVDDVRTEIFVDEPEAIRTVIDPRPALIANCGELHKEVKKILI